MPVNVITAVCAGTFQQGQSIIVYPTAGPIAHGLIGGDLTVVDLDSAYAELLGLPRAEIVGRSALDMLHPDDRRAGARLLQRVWREGQTLSATMRHHRRDDDPAWVNIYVSRVGEGEGGQLVVTCRPLPDGEGQPSTVEAQWQMARLLLRAIDGGKRAFGETLIGNPATEILLLAYLAEAEARAIGAGALAAQIGVSWPLTHRWLMALHDAGFVEFERRGEVGPDAPVRLSPRALAMIEAIFGALVAVVQGSLVPA